MFRKSSLAWVALAVAVGLLLAYAAVRPDQFDIERHLRIAAPADRLWPLVSELRGINRWNPYERKDPMIKAHYEGEASGVGSRYVWESDKVGIGSVEIIAVQPGRAIQMRLDFVEPFEAHNRAELRLQPLADGATEVHWRMQGRANFLCRLVGIFVNMDRMVGDDFEVGLLLLKQLAEVQG